ncbi:sensor histidine kinase [Couchioplanes caeruleus]|uniref:sensor histidine kinase n=1 Tax=Couchioplanes caeruleus TaxID=56438 RepID=UPI0011605A05|nr:sensor histidine kinase [Couchioplanes caeruleus]
MHVISHLQHAAQHRPHLADLSVALVILLVTLLTTAVPGHLPDGVSLASAAIACGILLLRRRWPYAVLVVSTIAAEVYLARHHGLGGILILAAPLFALYTVAELSDRRSALIVSGLVIVAVGVTHTLGLPSRRLGPENLALAALGGLAVAAGTASRHRRAYLAEVVRRAQDAERDRDADTRRRLTEERLRIARDLHDSVGHHLALINVQAGVTGHLLTGESEQVRDTLAQIRQSSRAALDELRESVGLLRQSDDPAPLHPAVGLAGLADLLGTFRRTGLQITARIDGRRADLPWAADHTAYRVIQEALTNVRKHAGPAEVALTLHHDGDAVTVVVDNDGPPVAPIDDAHAHGIVGMRERVTALGGTLLAGPRPTGGFRVTATIPTTS